jgi:hypothetical protein
MFDRTHPFNSIGHEPVETFHKEKKSEHNAEWNIKFITEDGKCQQALCYEEPDAII